MLLDTNAISALLDGDNELSAILGTVHQLYLPVVAVGEYLYGLKSSKHGHRLVAIFRKLESDCHLLELDRQTADHYATVRHELKLAGTPIPEGDLWIAALARQYGFEIVSRDMHFDAVGQIKRVGW